MSMDFRVDVGFFDHLKTMRLAASLGPLAPYHLLRLWAWARTNRPKGDLSGMTDREIGTAARWRKPEIFARTAADLGILDGPENGRSIHGWQERNGYAAHEEERKSRARAAADARWSKADRRGNANGNAKPMRGACDEHRTSNAPSPSPSPTPTPSPQRGGVGRARAHAREDGACGDAPADRARASKAITDAARVGVHEDRARESIASHGIEAVERANAAALACPVRTDAVDAWFDALMETAP